MANWYQKLKNTLGARSRAHAYQRGLQDAEAFYGSADMARTGELKESGHKPTYNSEDNRDRIALIAAARQLEKDFAPVGYAFNEIAKHIVPKTWRANTGNPETDVIVTRFIESSMEAERFDYAQANDAPESWRLLVKDRYPDGDSFQRYVIPRDEQSFFCQSIRADLIGSVSGDDDLISMTPGQSSRKKPSIPSHLRNINGCLIDSRGRRKWWLKYREIDASKTLGGHGDSGYEFQRKLNADSVSQYMDQEHSDDIRGISALKDSAREYHDLKVTWEYTRDNIKNYSSVAGVIYTEDGTPDPMKFKAANRGKALGPSASTTAGKPCSKCKSAQCTCGPLVQEVSGVEYHHLKTKEKMMQFRMEHPNASFMDACKHLLTVGAWSLKMPYGILFDASHLNGAPMRFELSKAACSITEMRLNVRRRLCQPWLRAKILEGIKLGILPFKRSQLTDLCKGKWEWTKLPTADEKYSTSSGLLLLDKGAQSLPDVCEALGTNFEQVLQENTKAAWDIYTKAEELWRRSGKEVNITYFLDMLAMKGPNGSSQHTTKSEPANTPQPANQDD